MSTGELEPDSPVTTAEETQPAEDEAPKRKLDIDVQISDVGPCKKHLRVEIARDEIDRQFEVSLGEMRRDVPVPGFRRGRAPQRLIQRRFRKEVSEQVKSTLLTETLQQIDDDYKLHPIAQPKLDVAAIEMPEEGPMHFEMDLEVQPEFALPEYKGLSVKRPVKTINDADVDAQLTLFLERHAQMVPKLEGGAEIGDFITADLTFLRGGQTLNEVKEIQFRLQSELRFQDGTVPRVGEALLGARPGDSRQAEARIGSGSRDPSLRGQTIEVRFQVHDLKLLRLPEVNASFLHGIGFDSREELRQALRELLERRLKTQQRQAIRREILDQLLKATPFDLPTDLVRRQERETIRRMALELKQEGMSESEIRAREAEIRANAHESALRGLKEFFLLAKIADAEDVKIEEDDFTQEIEAMAARSDESPRRVRARIEKDGLADALTTQILERKALDKVLEYAQYEEVPLVEQEAVETLDQTATTATEADEDESAEPAPESAGEPEPEAPAS